MIGDRRWFRLGQRQAEWDQPLLPLADNLRSLGVDFSGERAPDCRHLEDDVRSVHLLARDEATSLLRETVKQHRAIFAFAKGHVQFLQHRIQFASPIRLQLFFGRLRNLRQVQIELGSGLRPLAVHSLAVFTRYSRVLGFRNRQREAERIFGDDDLGEFKVTSAFVKTLQIPLV